MDESYSESDVSLSPSQILERLHVLRQLQLLQQGKLQKQRLQYQESPQNSTITEIVSQFSQSTSFNTFRSLLESPQDTSNDATPRLHNTSNKSPQVQPNDLIDGVSVLNLSQESEFILQSPLSSRSKASASSKAHSKNTSSNKSTESQSLPAKKQISLDDMPVLTPKKDFEALIIEKLKNEINAPKSKILQKENDPPKKGKKPFLRRGEGMARFGLKKNDIVIQKTHALPWKQNPSKKPPIHNPPKISKEKNVEVEIVVTKPKPSTNVNEKSPKVDKAKLSPNIKVVSKNTTQETDNNSKQSTSQSVDTSTCEIHASKPTFPLILKEVKINPPKGKHPLLGNKGKTWASVLTKEQDDFLRQLKQSDYYRNFSSPAKSVISDISCDENLIRLKQDREIAEQNMFELLENKVNHDSFDIDNSFIGRFLNKNLKGNNLECSGESTPLIMQRCLANNPELMRIFPNSHRKRNENSQSDVETCNSEYTDCCNETCISASSCCSCNTVEETNNSDQINRKNTQKNADQHDKARKSHKEAEKQTEKESCQNDNDTDIMKAEMAEMNAKLIATSDLLKDRLKELEDEIETFRKENSNLMKMREEIDSERHKFYEEKAAFEQKFNEEKILSEYYLAEEKDKLNKQKQIYERQVREIRGRLNKKEKDEVINLKKEISDLKEEIRLKDAKSTTIVARLRNQLKIMEKDKKELQDEVEKLKKENRRIQHSNEITRRMTNIKYLEQINKKLTIMKTNSTQSQVELDGDVKYKTFEIERQSRSRRVKPVVKNPLRVRAKSVPNLNVTSRYAKYFSQRDVVSPTERNQTLNIETYPYDEPDRESDYDIESLKDIASISSRDISDNEGENSLEKIYMERFQEHSKHIDQSNIVDKSKSSHSNSRHSYEKNNENTDAFFIRRSDSTSSSTRNSRSPNQTSYQYQPTGSNMNRSKSPVSILSHRSSSGRQSPISVTRESQKPDYLSNYSRPTSQKSKSPVSILSNHTHSSQRQPTVINRDQFDNRLAVSPEPAVSKASLTKTELKATELRKPDGSRELRFPNGNVKYLSADGKYCKFVYYNGDVKENFYSEGRIKYYYAETKTCHTTHPDGLEVLEFSDGQVEKRYKDGSSEIRLPNGSVRYYDPKNEHVREEWRFPDGATLTVAAAGDRRVVFANGQVEVHTRDHKRREFPDGTVKLLYNDGTSETRYSSGRIRIKDKHGNLIMDSVPG